MRNQGRFDFGAEAPARDRDLEARRAAADPTRNVALEASAGTGKTRVLVDRYVGLLLAGVKPRHVLAITFTRKAAAEMRQRILDELAARRRAGAIPDARWRALADERREIGISTIDAFCLSLLREFPLEADVDPGFDLADETEIPRLVDAALDRALRIGRGLATIDEDVALVFAELGELRLREGLARLLDRRLIASDALDRFLRGPDLTAAEAMTRLVSRIREAVEAVPGGVEGLLASGPPHPAFDLFAADLRALLAEEAGDPGLVQALVERIRLHVLTREGEPRKRLDFRKADFRSPADHARYQAAIGALGPSLVAALEAFRRELNLVLARGVRRLFTIARREYQSTLHKHGVLDFAEVLERTLALLRQQDEFSRSRYKLEARYRHVLVDEFQDTSRAQWELVQLLVRAWAEGEGLSDTALPPSIFIVGDRKQSIYGFRDAEVAVLDDAARYIAQLRASGQTRHAITRSFRAVAELLAFVNDVFALVEKQVDRRDAFRYDEDDAFPLAGVEGAADDEGLGVAAGTSDEDQAEAVAGEIARLLASGAIVRDRATGVRRAVGPGDVAVLFRTRDSHRLFEQALERRGIPFYVYKGLGFFDADEIKDVLALVAFLADPWSNLRAAALLRSRLVRLSDAALKELAPGLAAAIVAPGVPAGLERLAPDDRLRLELLRGSIGRWLGWVDRLPPAELLDRVLAESAYAAELAGPTRAQARENLKKLRGLVRRMQNRGYLTLARLVDQMSALVAGGDESSAIVDAVDAVNLMTVHAAKGLEFPVVFVVNLAKGSGGSRDPIRVIPAPCDQGDAGEPSVAVGDQYDAADDDAERREAEETKRLLYVALTRARDRLYLATSVGRDGRFAPARGSLGRVLPPPLWDAFAQAATAESGTILTWEGPGRRHRLRLIAARPEARVAFRREAFVTRPSDFAPLAIGDAPRRVPATAHASRARDAAPAAPPPSSADVRDHERQAIDRFTADEPAVSTLAGALVHRALAAGLFLSQEAPGTAAVARAMQALVTPEEHLQIDDSERLFETAAAAYLNILVQPELRALLESGVRLHEVPFSLREDETTIVRGTIDCVVRHPDGRVTVLEVKTGRPRAEHEAQLAVYVRAAKAVFGTEVEGRLVYPRGLV